MDFSVSMLSIVHVRADTHGEIWSIVSKMEFMCLARMTNGEQRGHVLVGVVCQDICQNSLNTSSASSASSFYRQVKEL